MIQTLSWLYQRSAGVLGRDATRKETLRREFQEITHASDPGQWKVVFFWPMDFTFVCPTEIAAFGRRERDFADRAAQVPGISSDTHFVHLAWRRQHEDLRERPSPGPRITRARRRGACSACPCCRLE